MACEEYESSLIHAALGESLPVEAAAHLKGCAVCQAFLAEQKDLADVVDGVLQAAAATEPSVDFIARVRRRVDQERVEGRFAWRMVAWATLAPVLVGVAIGLWRRPQVEPTKVADAPVTPLLMPPSALVPVAPIAERAVPRERAVVRHEAHEAPRRQPEVLIDRAAADALVRYVQAMRTQKGAIAGSLDARVAPVELPRYEGVLLESTAATAARDLPQVSVITDLPRFERSEL
jgi:hypothetical protein